MPQSVQHAEVFGKTAEFPHPAAKSARLNTLAAVFAWEDVRRIRPFNMFQNGTDNWRHGQISCTSFFGVLAAQYEHALPKVQIVPLQTEERLAAQACGQSQAQQGGQIALG